MNENELKDKKILLKQDGETITINEYTFNYLHEYAAANLVSMTNLLDCGLNVKSFQQIWLIFMGAVQAVMFEEKMGKMFIKNVSEFLEETQSKEYDA